MLISLPVGIMMDSEYLRCVVWEHPMPSKLICIVGIGHSHQLKRPILIYQYGNLIHIIYFRQI